MAKGLEKPLKITFLSKTKYRSHCQTFQIVNYAIEHFRNQELLSNQGIIQKKSAFGSRMLPFVIFDKK